ncbi:hypothetical protein AURDEDRAFT_176601 [Auricularia subglabra TFB-10046 SS5]|uniref:Uncharacterized protein n=1 Tax=Auricularia subglabra (strain TFB-10046 / SS5) TaxID=717982 RepID=J0WPJ8_AURST|nr:hypothetical protein AURDEDRAFT_176601 [Auricularia subglabra TFB-10046 SS5]
MAKKQSGAVDEPAAAPRCSSRRGAVQAEEPVPQAASQGRRAPATARGRALHGTQQGDEEASPLARKTGGRGTKAKVADETPEPDGGDGGKQDEEGEEDEEDEEMLSPSKASPSCLAAFFSALTRAVAPRRKARAAANARARAAEAVCSEEERNTDGGNSEDEAEQGEVQAGASNDEQVEEPEFALNLRVPRGTLTPSPRKGGAASPVDDAVSDTEDGAFLRQQKERGLVKDPRCKPSAVKPKHPAAARGTGENFASHLQNGTPGREHAKRSQPREGTGDAVEEQVVEEVEEAGADERPKARRQTKAMQEELAEVARVSALEELGSRMVGMLGQLQTAGVRLDFTAAPVAFGSAPPAPGLTVSPAKAYSRAENFKGDGSSREGKPSTDGRKYRAVWGSYDDFEVGLNISDYTRKNNNAPRDTTELFYPLVRKAYAMNRYRESYVAVIAMPVSGDLKGMTYAWGSPRLLKDLLDFLDDCAFEVSHGTMDKRAHGYAKALSDYKRKALKDLAELNRKHVEDQSAGASGSSSKNVVVDADVGQSGTPGKQRSHNPVTPARGAAPPQTPGAGQKRKRAPGDNGEEERPGRETAGGRPAAGNKSKTVKVAGKPTGGLPQRRPLTPRNASMRGVGEDAMDVVQ